MKASWRPTLDKLITEVADTKGYVRDLTELPESYDDEIYSPGILRAAINRIVLLEPIPPWFDEVVNALPSPVSEVVIAKTLAAWWSQFIAEDKRTSFVEALVADTEWQGHSFILSCDYDPDQFLLGAIRDVGIECRGCFFSAEKIGFPMKTTTRMLYEVPVVKRGYGVSFVPIEVTQ